MSDEWVQYEFQPNDVSFLVVNQRGGLVPYLDGIGRTVDSVWDDPQNQTIRDSGRTQVTLQVGDKFFLLRQSFDADAREETYEVEGDEGSLWAICQRIQEKVRRAGATLIESPLLPARLYFMIENGPFRGKHEQYRYNGPGYPQDPSDTLRFSILVAHSELHYHVKPRPPVPQPVVPAHTDSDPATPTVSTNTCVEGRRYASVTILPGSFRPYDRKADTLKGQSLKFTFSIAAKLKSLSVTILRSHANTLEVLFWQSWTSGAYTDPTASGAASWEWDGYSNDEIPQSILDAMPGLTKVKPNRHDTRWLRSPILVRLDAVPDDGCAPSSHLIPLKIVSVGSNYLDITIDRSPPGPITYARWVRARLHFECSNLTVADIAKFASLAASATSLVLPGAGTTVAAYIATKAGLARLPDDELARVKAALRDGIARQWRRAGSYPDTVLASAPCVHLDGDEYQFESEAVERSGSVPFRVLRPIDFGFAEWKRGCNLGVVVHGELVYVPVRPGFVPETLGETFAHEYGHSILYDAFDAPDGTDVSVTHKGSTGGALDQNPKPTQPAYPPAPAEIDLMQYYNDPHSGTWVADPSNPPYGWFPEEIARTLVAEKDVKGLMSLLVFRIGPFV